MKTPEDRWHARAIPNPQTGCWVWDGAPNDDGYAHLKVGGRTVKAHRFGYELYVGQIPEGMVLDHLCRNRMCVNPEHLEPVTSGENTRRGETLAARQLAQTHCKWGHPLAGANLRMENGTKRKCRTCARLRAACQRVALGVASTQDLARAAAAPWAASNQ